MSVIFDFVFFKEGDGHLLLKDPRSKKFEPNMYFRIDDDIGANVAPQKITAIRM